jgi:hypothetical protein
MASERAQKTSHKHPDHGWKDQSRRLNTMHSQGLPGPCRFVVPSDSRPAELHGMAGKTFGANVGDYLSTEQS